MFFLRHGQTVFNEKMDRTGIDPEMPDAGLTAFGKEQVAAAAPELAGLGLVRIVSSPYARALETADIAATALGLGVEVEPLIGEHRLYSCDVGSPTDVMRKRFPHVAFNGFSSANWWLPFPESAASLRARVKAFKEKWSTRKDAPRTLFVSHFYFIKAVTGDCLQNAQVARLAD